MILLVDADSLIWSSCYKTKREPDEDIFFEDINEAYDKFDEVFMKIINDIEENHYPVDDVRVFADSKGNFRKMITPVYKANRKPRDIPPLLPFMQKYVRDTFNAEYMYGVETDDVVASTWKLLADEVGRENVMIVSIDKDYKQFPCLIYNYHKNHQCIYDISEQEALYNFYEQMIIGDTADNVNYCKGYGKKYAEKLLSDKKTKFSMSKAVFGLFKQIYKSKAREKYRECYNLLKLRDNLYDY